MKKKFPAPAIDITRLDRQQLEFIQTKVMELGSRDAVKQFYKDRDSVGEFARICAEGLWGKGGG